MSLLTLECETIEPVIIGDRQIKNIILSANSIPPNTVRGALYSKLVRENCDNERITECTSGLSEALKREIMSPTASFGPVRILKDGIESKVAHIFMYSDKMKEDYHIDTLRENIDRLTRGETVSDILDLIPEMEKSYPKSIGGRLIISRNGKIEKVSLLKWSYINIVINENTRTTTKLDEDVGAIFSYEALQPGLKFKQTIYIENERIANEIIEKLGGEGKHFTIYIGRGVTRGFGCTDCTVKKQALEEVLADTPNYLVKNNAVIAIAQTNIFEIKPSNSRHTLITTFPYIEKISTEKGTVLEIKKYKVLRSDLKYIWGKGELPAAFVKTEKIKSWATLHGPRPIIDSATPGSVFVYKTRETNDLNKTLRKIELTGANNLSRLGYNYLEFLKEDDFP